MRLHGVIASILGALATGAYALDATPTGIGPTVPIVLWAVAAVVSLAGALAARAALGPVAGGLAALGAVFTAFPQDFALAVLWALGVAALVEGPRQSNTDADPRVLVVPTVATLLVLVLMLAPIVLLRLDPGVRASIDVGHAAGVAVAGLVMGGLVHLMVTRRRPDAGSASAIALVLVGLTVLLALVALAPGADADTVRIVGTNGEDVDVRSWRPLAPGQPSATTAKLAWNGDPLTTYLMTADVDVPRNVTLQSASIVISYPFAGQGEAVTCAATTIEARLLNTSFDDAAVTWNSVPDSRLPVDAVCTAANITLDVTAHFEELVQTGGELHGWAIQATDAIGPANVTIATYENSAIVRPEVRLRYETHPPVLEDVRIADPPGVGDGYALDPEAALTVAGTATDLQAPPRRARVELRVGTTVVGDANAPVAGDGTFDVTVGLDRFIADGTPLRALTWVEDWDGNPSPRATTGNIVVDAAPPTFGGLYNETNVRYRGDVLLNSTPTFIGLIVADSTCPVLGEGCVNVTATWDGTPIRTRFTRHYQNETAWGLDVPPSLPGEHELQITARDGVGRAASMLRRVEVRDLVPPTVEGLAVDGALARPGVQEVGGIVTLDATLTDKGVITDVQAVVTAPDGTATRLDMDEVQGLWTATHAVAAAGPHDVTVVVTDGGDNEVERTFEAAFDGLPAEAPAITATPAGGHRAVLAPIEVAVVDPNLDPSTVTVSVARNGEIVNDAQTEREASGDRVDVTILAPDGATGDALTIDVSATDALGATNTTTFAYTIDASTPRISAEVVPTAGGWVGPDARLVTNVTDEGSGLDAVRLTIDAGDGEPRTRTVPSEGATPIEELVGTLRTGPLNLTLRATDAAGNDAVLTIGVRVDADAPTVRARLDGQRLVADVDERGSGVASARAGVSGPFGFATLDMTPSGGGAWAVQLTNVSKGDELRVWVEVLDAVGQRGSHGEPGEPIAMTVPNTPPRPRLTAPPGDLRLEGGTVEAAWSVSDPDPEPVTIELRLEHAVLGTRTVVATSGSSATVDLDGLTPGAYRLVLEAFDPETSATDERSIWVGDPDAWLRADEVAGRVAPGEPIEVSLQVLVPASGAVAIAERGGEPPIVAELEGGADGRWVGAIDVPAEEGSYDVRVVVTYADGDVARLALGSVDVAESRGAAEWLVAALIVLVVIGAAAAAVVVLMRRSEAGP